MYGNLESDEKRRREVVSSLYRSLMQNWDIPQSIQDYYGFSEDYRLFHQLEGMDSVKMTGRRPYAGGFFRYLRNERAKQEQAASREDTPRRNPSIPFKPKAIGRGRGI